MNCKEHKRVCRDAYLDCAGFRRYDSCFCWSERLKVFAGGKRGVCDGQLESARRRTFVHSYEHSCFRLSGRAPSEVRCTQEGECGLVREEVLLWRALEHGITLAGGE
jgi:hypothetical protein